MPACSVRLRGQFWPQEANENSALLMRLARSGDLRMCTRGTWRYHWESPTVHVNQLRKGGEIKPHHEGPVLSTASAQ